MSQYTCAACHETFDSGWTDEEARAEQMANGFDKVPCDITCDDCHKKAMEYRAKLAEDAGLTPKELDAALCEDDGCPHHGTPHVCVSSLQDAAAAIEQLRNIEAVMFKMLSELLVIPYDDGAPFTEPIATLMCEAFERAALAAGWTLKVR